MEDLNNLHSADGSFLGFLYQIERALIWLSSSSVDAIVGVEVEDDITVQLVEGSSIKKIYEQAKHSQTSRIPYSNQSEDLWKTLHIWIEAVTSGKVDADNAMFSFLTNKKIPKNRLILELDKSKSSDKAGMNKVIDSLLATAAKLPKSLKVYAESVMNCPRETLIKIVDKIVVMDADYNHNSGALKKTLKSNLSLADDLPFDYIYRSLFGYVAEDLIEKWRNREAGLIKVSSFNQQYNQLVADYKKKSFYEKTVDSLPVSDQDIEKNQGRNYVEQLHMIGCDEEEVIEAIHDFIRAATERSRIALDGEISQRKFELYFEDLLGYWKSISKPKFKFASEPDHVKVGYEVYHTCIVYKGKLNSYEPEQGYTYRGSYHYLSDQIRLGWHPKWATLKKTK